MHSKTNRIADFSRNVASILLPVLVCCTLLFSQEVFAWKVKTHVWLSKQVVDEIRQNAISRGDGTSFVSIYRPDIEPNNIVINTSPGAMLEDHEYGYTDQLGEKIGDYEVAPEIVAMLTDDRAMMSYFAGVMGPDNYPDIATGQTRVHPHTHVATDEWFKYLFSKLDELNSLNFTGITDFNDAEDIIRESTVNSASRTADERAVRAFIYGYMTHGIGDIFMHTFVNNYAGGEFTIGVNMFKHNLIESYVAKQTPALNLDIVQLDVPEAVLNFIFHYLGDVQPGSELQRLMPWVNPLAPLDSLNPNAEWNGLYEVSFPRIFSTFRNQLKNLKDNPQVLTDVYDQAYNDALMLAQDCGSRPIVPGVPPCGLLYIQADAIQAASLTASIQHAVLQPFLENWINKINIGLEEWVELNHEIGRHIHLVESLEINKDNDKRYVNALVQEYINIYFLPMLGVPDGLGISQQRISEIQDFFWPEHLKNRIADFKLNMTNNLFLAATSVLPRSGHAGDVVATILPEEKMDFNMFMDYHFSPQTYFDDILLDRSLDSIYRKDDHKNNSKALSKLELEQKLGLDKPYTEANGDARFNYINPNWFRPAWNVRQLNKMLFLSKNELVRLVADINCDSRCSSVAGFGNAAIPDNIMLDFLGSLDRDNQWKAINQKYADPFRDFSDSDFSARNSVDGSYTFADADTRIDDFNPRFEFDHDLTTRQMVFADCYAYLQLFKIQEGERYNENCLPPIKIEAPVLHISGNGFTDEVNNLLAFSATYSEPVQISVSHSDPDVVMFYTISELNNPVLPVNNSDPDAPLDSRSHPYNGPFSMSAIFNSSPRPLVVRVQAYKPSGVLAIPSEVQQATITIDAPLPDVSFFPPTPNHTSFVNVSLGMPAGASVFYTTNGVDPDYNATSYQAGQQIRLGLGSHTIKAIAYRLGYNASVTSAAQYNVYDPSAIRVADPLFDPPSNGNYVNSLLFNAITHTEGAVLRYEITYFDSSNNPTIKVPNQFSPILSEPLLLDKPGFYAVRVIGYKSGLPPSNLASIGYTVVDSIGSTDTPLIEPAETEFSNPVMLQMSADTNPATGTGIQIFYTLDGTDPVVLLNALGNYQGSFQIDGTTTIKAKATRAFFTTSQLSQKTFLFKAAPVEIDMASGTYENGLQVSLASITLGASIRYTTNGAVPNESSDLYLGPINISQSTTLIARAFKPGYETSDVRDASYEVYTPVVPFVSRHPQSRTVRENKTTSFSVAAGGVPDVLYQWQHNGVDLPGENTAILELASVRQADTGTYRAVVSNSSGLTYSDDAKLLVQAPATIPVFLSQSQNLVVEIGKPVELAVQVSGTPDPVIKWYKNGIDLQAQFGSQLRYTQADLFHTGEYYAIATNEAGEVKSVPFYLVVTEPLEATVTPPDTTGNTASDSSDSGGGAMGLYFLLLITFLQCTFRKVLASRHLFILKQFG